MLNRIKMKLRKRKKRIVTAALSLCLLSMTTMCFPMNVKAEDVSDVIAEMGSNFSTPEYENGSEGMTGLGLPMNVVYGGYAEGYGGFSVLGPLSAEEMAAALEYVDTQSDNTTIQTTKLKGCEVREYTLASEDGVGIGLVLDEYFITVELYQTGKNQDENFQIALGFAQQILDAMENRGLLKQAAPDLQQDSPKEENISEEAQKVEGAIPVGEVPEIANSGNIYAVQNGPTAPTEFTITTPHLLVYISNYHWNNAQGKTPGTIGLTNQDGNTYGPWQASGQPGQGGVPDAYWEVFPNIVIPAGTYTITDSDSSTWAQNSESDGRGMSSVKATPNFQVTEPDQADAVVSQEEIEESGITEVLSEEPVAIGNVGSIPGPDSNMEAVTGVVIPGLITVLIGALSGLGGGGNLPPMEPLVSGTGPGIPPVGTPPVSPAMEENWKNPEIFMEPPIVPPDGISEIRIDTSEMDVFQKPIIDTDSIPVFGMNHNKTATGDDIFSNYQSPTETKVSIDIYETEQFEEVPPTSKNQAGTDMEQTGGLVGNEQTESPVSGKQTVSETVQQDVSKIQNYNTKTQADGYNAEGYDRTGYDAEGYDRSGYDAEGYDRTGYDAEGYDRTGYDAEGYDRTGYDAEGYNQTGYNAEGYDRTGYDAEGYNQTGYNAEGYDRTGYDAEGYDRSGYDAEGYDRTGYDAEGYDRSGYDAEGYDRTGYDAEGYNQTGYNAEGYDRTSYDAEGYDRTGYDAEGYDRTGYNAEGYNRSGYDTRGYDREGYDIEGYNQNGYNSSGYNRDGYDKNGYNAEGYNAKGYNREGYDRTGYNAKGYDAEGYNREGYNIDGYDREGYNENGYDQEGYDKEGFNNQGYNRDGYSKEAYNRDGYNKEGYDKNGFDRAGYNKAGYDKNGFNRDGFDNEGYKKDGFNKEGYDREGYNREGFDKEGNQRDGYNKDGFNKDGYDKDGYDLDGFNYEGYNRSGYDPWGYDKQGYDKEGYHWSGYNRDGFDRNNRSWEEPDYDPNNRNPFDGGPVIIGNTNQEWKPVKPPLGQPYPKTVEKYGPKPWTTEPETPSKPEVPKESNVPTESEVPSQSGTSQPVAQQPETAQTSEPGTPKHGEKRVLTGKTDGRSMEVEYNGETGEWTNTESGNMVDPDKFEQWQEDMAEDKRRSEIDTDKMSKREDANSKAIDQNLSDWKRLEQMEKVADKYNIGEKDGPGDVDKAIQKLKDDMLAGKQIDKDKMEQINKVIDSRIKGTSTADSGERWEETPWYKDWESALKANQATAKQIVTGQDEDGTISWLGMASRMAIGAATGGASEYIMTVAEAMSRIKEGIDNDESGFRATARAIGMVIFEEEISRYLEAASKLGFSEMAARYPKITNKIADAIETGALKIQRLNQAASAKLGMISKQGAKESIDQINKQLAENAADIGAEKVIKKSLKNVDDLTPAKKEQLIKDQLEYNKYRQQAEENVWNVSDKIQKGQDLSVEDILKLKSDPASMRTLKNVENVNGLGRELGESGAKNLQSKFNNTLQTKVYDPCNADVRKALSAKYGNAEIRVETIRTSGTTRNSWDINTDNDVVALRNIGTKEQPEWVEVPRKEWQDVYNESYAKNTGFNPDDAAKKFPDENWSKMSRAEQNQKWAELHGESPMDVYHVEGARDFSNQRTAILNGKNPEANLIGQDGRMQRTLIDSEQLAMMEKNKVNHYWQKGDLKNQTEALEQMKKTGKLAQTLEKGHKSMDYKITEMPDNMKKGISVINDNSLSPSVRAQKLKELGYNTPGDFSEKLTSRIGALRAAQKKS